MNSDGARCGNSGRLCTSVSSVFAQAVQERFSMISWLIHLAKSEYAWAYKSLCPRSCCCSALRSKSTCVSAHTHPIAAHREWLIFDVTKLFHYTHTCLYMPKSRRQDSQARIWNYAHECRFHSWTHFGSKQYAGRIYNYLDMHISVSRFHCMIPA